MNLILLLFYTEINPVEVEEYANYILGPEAKKETADILKVLGGRRRNRVFAYFGIDCSERMAVTLRVQRALKRAAKTSAGLPSSRPKVAAKRKRSAPAPSADEASEDSESSAEEDADDNDRASDTSGFAKELEENMLDKDDISSQPTAPVAAAPTKASSAAGQLPKPRAAPIVTGTGTASKPFSLAYSDDEPESDEEPLKRRHRVAPQLKTTEAGTQPDSTAPKPSSPPKSTDLVTLPSSSCEPAEVAKPPSPDDQQSSSDRDTSRTKDDEGYFVGNVDPDEAARRLDLPEGTLLFGGKFHRVLNFASGPRERALLQKASDTFSFPVMEDELGEESGEDIITHAQDLSLKAFVACRNAKRRMAKDIHILRLSARALESALKKEMKVVKTLHSEKVSLAKKNEELEIEIARLRESASEAATLRNKVETLEASLSSCTNELNTLKPAHAAFVKEHEGYCCEMETLVRATCDRLSESLRDFGSTPSAINLDDICMQDILTWITESIKTLSHDGKAFGELGAGVAAHAIFHTICSLLHGDDDGGEPVLTKSDLKKLRSPDFVWPKNVDYAGLPAFPKNLGKSFMRNFFAERGYALTVEEGRRLLHQVFPYYIHFLLLSFSFRWIFCQSHFLCFADRSLYFDCSFVFH